MNGLVPEHYADFGSAEPWVARTILQAQTVVNAVPALAPYRRQFDLEMGETFEALAMAFAALRELRGAVDRSAPALELEGTYDRLYRQLWTAYKDRFQTALRALGYDLGFVWQNDERFEAGAAQLVSQRLELGELMDLIRRYRREFQNALAYYRNEYVEHRKDVDPRMVASFHNLPAAEDSFDRVWRAIEAIVAGIVVAALPHGFGLVEIPEAERDPSRPERFRVARTE